MLHFIEPPDADPHVRWCGEGHRKRWPLPDYLLFDAEVFNEASGWHDFLRVNCKDVYD